MSGNHDNGDESRNYSQSNAPVEPPAPANSAIGCGAGRDPSGGRARSGGKPHASALALRPDRRGALYRAAPRDGHQRVVQPQPRAHHAGVASRRLRRLQPRRGPRELRREPRPLDIGIAAALVAFFIGCEWGTAPLAFGAFMSAAGVILLAAVLQESHRLAFRDELTNLPSRRALEERLTGLGPTYAIGMIDVDHFKQFNDAHGHHIGDQVLKLVAARLAAIEGGGTSYRYGGEEFCVLFSDRTQNSSPP